MHINIHTIILFVALNVICGLQCVPHAYIHTHTPTHTLAYMAWTMTRWCVSVCVRASELTMYTTTKILLNREKNKNEKKIVRTIGSFDTNRISGGVYHSELNGMRLNGRCRTYIVSRMKNGSSKQWFSLKKENAHTTHKTSHACTVYGVFTHTYTYTPYTQMQTYARAHTHTYTGANTYVISVAIHKRTSIRDETSAKVIAVGRAVSYKWSQCSSDYVCVHMKKRSFCASQCFLWFFVSFSLSLSKFLGNRDVKK